MRKVIKIYSLVIVIIMITLTAVGVVNNNLGKTSHDSEKTIKENNKNITFDFPNTELKIFAQFVAKLCSKTLIGEDLLKGKINVKSQKKLMLSQLMKVFKLLLASKGLVYTETDIYLEILPISDSIMKVYNINYLESADLAKALTQMFRMSFRVGNKPENIQITSVDESNSLMVLAPVSQQVEIEKSIRELDVRTSQVLLDFMIVEVSKATQFGFGVTYSYKLGNSTIATTPGSLATFTTSAIPSAGGFNNSTGDFTVDIQGVDKKTKLKVLSRPRVTSKENEKATLKIGVKENYISGSSSLGGNQGITQTTASNEIGLTIEATPRISSNKNVILELKLTITNVLGNYSFYSGGDGTSDSDSTFIPIVGERTVNNTASVMDGETIVIGGLLKNSKTIIRSAPPVVGDIPLVGWMFAKESEETEQDQLIILITPTVINNRKDNIQVLKNETNELRDFTLGDKDKINQMLKGEKSKADDVFNLFEYFKDGKYRKEQGFIKQPENMY